MVPSRREGESAGSYVKRVTADQAHTHDLAIEHLVLGKSGLFLRRVEAFGVFEEIPYGGIGIGIVSEVGLIAQAGHSGAQ